MNPFDRRAMLGQVRLAPRLGQYSWNSAGMSPAGGGGAFSWNSYGQGTPEQRLLTQAQESMKAPPPPTPEQQLLQQSQQSMQTAAGGQCYTCANGGDIRTGVDAGTADALRGQGFRCRKDECASKGSGFSYGQFGNVGNYGSAPGAVSQGNYGNGGDSGDSYGMMSSGMYGRVRTRPLMQARF